MTFVTSRFCDHAAVGVMITTGSDSTLQFLLLEQVPARPGFAPPTIHQDGHATHLAAAHTEIRTQTGYHLKTPVVVESGHLSDMCSREPGPGLPGHFWHIYHGSISGDLSINRDQVISVRWATVPELQVLAEITARYARGELTLHEFLCRPGLQPVWVHWLNLLGHVTLPAIDLRRIHTVACTPGRNTE
jgi:hypothetical protein